MSKIAIKAIAAATLAVVTTAAFALTESRTLTVTATIPGTCTLTTSGPMAFGNLDMSSSANEVKTVTATYKCATGNRVTSFTVGGQTVGPYNGVMTGLGSSSNTLAYKIDWTAPTAYDGEGFAVTGKQVLLTGTVLNTEYITKPADSYSHAVVIAINY